MKRLLRPLSLAFVFLLLSASAALAQSGKISGTVTDTTGMPLPGVNVVLVQNGEVTTMGTVTNAEGFYSILNIPPGTYGVRASFIGYETETVQDVQVRIGLTTQVDFELRPETLGLEGVVVTAEDQVVQPDLAASRVDISAEDIENLPVTDLESVVGLQAGVQGLSIRGSDADETAVLLDGFGMNSGRSARPYTNFAYTAVEVVQVQSGGMSAKYGNARAGMVNIVTQEGPRDHYTADVMLQYRPPTKKHFGISPAHPSSYWMRPYLDPQVAFEGTNKWDAYTQRQYPDFEGFNQLVKTIPGLTPEQAQEVFLFRHRKDLSIRQPDYVVDGSFGGPVPLISDYLGDLRFMASYRQEQEQYIVPLSTDGFNAYNARLKLTTDITPQMKLDIQLMRGAKSGTNDAAPRTGPTRIRMDGNREYVSAYGAGVSYNPGGQDAIFGKGVYSVSDIDRYMVAAKLNHMIGGKTFYEAQLQWTRVDYRTQPPAACNAGIIETIGGWELNASPLCFHFSSFNSITGMRMGTHWSEFRDSSSVQEWSARFDLTSQINRYNQLMAGVEFSVTEQDVQYQYLDFLLNPNDIYTGWHEYPIYAAAYVQDKLEFKGMVATLGLRLDYFDTNTRWYVFDTYTDAFLGANAQQMDELLKQKPVAPEIYLSPRLGVSFPVAEGSKLYFNYGHFYQSLAPEWLYMIERRQLNDEVRRISDPSVPRPKLVQYEVGYEQQLLDQFLLRVAGYYKDAQNQPRWVSYHSLLSLVEYETNRAGFYEDIRGFEISLFKNVGTWFQGFVNYTYQVESEGTFGYSEFYQNPVRQREYERTTGDYYQFKPLPQPYARLSLTFMTPVEFGPAWSDSFYPLGDWRINLLAHWKSGDYFTFVGEAFAPDVQDNVQWAPYRMVDLRLSKNFSVAGVGALFFADIKNVFNIKNLNHSAFQGARDYESYMNSLHLPKDAVQEWEDGYQPRNEQGDPIYGDDQPGDLPDYADPPNLKAFRYLFPRSVNFGLRFSF